MGLMNRAVFLVVPALVLALALVPGLSPKAGEPLRAGHYGGPAAGTWSVTSSPKWLRSVALAAIGLREGLSEVPASGSCRGVIGLDVPGDGAPITGAARCEFPGELARYNDRVASLSATETAGGVSGTGSCCGGPAVDWKATREGDRITGTATGSTGVTPMSVETRFGSVEVSLRVDWTVRFVADRVP